MKYLVTERENFKYSVTQTEYIPQVFEFNNLRFDPELLPTTIETYLYPSPDTIGEMVHPSILFFSNGWNGYKYWMAYCPFYNADTQYENPSLAVSDDGVTWITPPGLINPIIPKPVGGALADVNIIVVSGVMYMIWRDSTVAPHVQWSMSTNGINWNSQQLLVNCTCDSGCDFTSPSMLYENGTWRIYHVDDSLTGGVLRRSSSILFTGPWDAGVVCEVDTSLSNLDAEAGRLWHIEVRKIGSIYIGIGYYDISGNIYLLKSADGLNFIASENPILDIYDIFKTKSWYNSLYKATLYYDDNGYRVNWASTDSGGDYRFGLALRNDNIFVKINDDYSREVTALWSTEIAKANNKEEDYIFADDFQRADANSLGTSSSGDLWNDELTFPDRLGISSNKAVPQDNEAKCYVSMGGVTDYEITIILGDQSGTSTWDTYVVIKRISASQYIAVRPSDIIQVNLLSSPLFTITYSEISNVLSYKNKINEFRVRVDGSRIRSYLNGLIIIDKTLEDIGYLSSNDISTYIASDVIGIRKTTNDGDILGIFVKEIS